MKEEDKIKLDTITGNDKIADFVGVYNKNNATIKKEIDTCKENIETIQENYNKKADKTYIDSILDSKVSDSVNTQVGDINSKLSDFKVDVNTEIDNKLSEIDKKLEGFTNKDDFNKNTEDISSINNKLSDIDKKLESLADKDSLEENEEDIHKIYSRLTQLSLNIEELKTQDNEFNKTLENINQDLINLSNGVDSKVSDSVNTQVGDINSKLSEIAVLKGQIAENVESINNIHDAMYGIAITISQLQKILQDKGIIS